MQTANKRIVELTRFI